MPSRPPNIPIPPGPNRSISLVWPVRPNAVTVSDIVSGREAGRQIEPLGQRPRVFGRDGQFLGLTLLGARAGGTDALELAGSLALPRRRPARRLA